MKWSRLWVDSEAASWFQELGLDNVREAGRNPPGIPVGKSSSGAVFRIPPERSRPGLYLKVFRPRGWTLLRTALRGSDPETEFRAIRFLETLGIPAVHPLALGVSTCAGFTRTAILLTREVQGSRNLEAILSSGALTELRARKPEQVARALAGVARHVASMHRAGYLDGDLHFRNILFEEPDGGDLRWWFLDSPRARRARPGSRRHFRGAVHDLACLDKHAPSWFRRPERLRFFLAYAGRSRLEASDRTLLARVEARRRHLLEKRERKLYGAARHL